MIFEKAKGCLESDDKQEEEDETNVVENPDEARAARKMAFAMSWGPKGSWATATLAAVAFSAGMAMNLLKASPSSKHTKLASGDAPSYGAVDTY